MRACADLFLSQNEHQSQFFVHPEVYSQTRQQCIERFVYLLAKQAADALAVAQTRRCQFLEAELKLCWTALDIGGSEMRDGRREITEREILSVQKASGTILHFLPEVANPAKRQQLTAELNRVKAALQALELEFSCEDHMTD
ncbi:hypothetical protein ACPOL_5049 [Acidisarcina polymorpha]|uniref:Uncharacterized protein n=1 Tax=Acidisarcina polymorpha TaxID=2211140 RepID=A0A2Z5G692_9BACT|nr:hypothetical protein [Acidisarcina polymorpha]AXC14307.1 hypothetical protein ACPOL_5049 [Acidisarcina polymorpha]